MIIHSLGGTKFKKNVKIDEQLDSNEIYRSIGKVDKLKGV